MYDKSGYSERVATFIDKEDIPNGGKPFYQRENSEFAQERCSSF